MWWTLGLMGANALMGAQRANRQQEDQKRYNLMQAEQTRYSPWTGQVGRPTTNSAPSALESGIGGAIGGAATGQSLGLGSPWGGATPQQDTTQFSFNEKPNLFNQKSPYSLGASNFNLNKMGY